MNGFIKIGVNIINLDRVESIMILDDQINFYFNHGSDEDGLRVISKNVVPEKQYDKLKAYISTIAEKDFSAKPV